MSKQTEKNLLIVSSLPRLYQDLLRGVVAYQELGNRIIKQIKAAHAFRQVDKVRELAGVLINIPLHEWRLIGQCYLVWCDCREQNYQPAVLETIIDQTNTHKATRSYPEQRLIFIRVSLKTPYGSMLSL